MGITRSVFLEDETLEMGFEVRMSTAFPRDRQGDGLGQTKGTFPERQEIKMERNNGRDCKSARKPGWE